MANEMVEEQAAPVRTAEPGVWDLVLADMAERDRVGRERYGTPLQATNGRDHLVDAYQEALDLVVYLRAEIQRRRNAGQVLPNPGPRGDVEETHTLRARVTELLESNTRLVNERRRTDRTAMLRALHGAFGHGVGLEPHPAAALNFHVQITVEEFCELLAALFEDVDAKILEKTVLDQLAGRMRRSSDQAFIDFVDAYVDTGVTLEGLAVACGLPTHELWEEVQRANMEKRGGPIDPTTGKQLKPKGWKPPDIRGVLRRAGWRGMGG